MADDTQHETQHTNKTGSAARRPNVGDKPSTEHDKTGAGQEARRGVPPGEHADEHQSNYGGGGVHGGVDADETTADDTKR